ncbi:MAG: HK97 family phage prohead protease [Rhizobiales bacterium]|nr:HK97 family phage prohead protease [Hyphomicrobiales bacterium]
MLMRKHINLQDAVIKMDGDSGSFEGYASVFGGVDSYGDTIVRGAFESTLRNNGKPKMFFNHEWTMPIGKWTTVREDDHGLYVAGELTPGLNVASEVRAAMKHQTLDGLSIGGFLKKGDYDETEGGRVIRRWSSLVEISPVVFPADAAARVDLGSVKGSADLAEAIEEISSVRELESFLRDAGGLTKGAAVALVARAKVVMGLQGEPAPDTPEAKQLQLLGVRMRLAALAA